MSKRAEERAIDAWAIYEYREHPKGLYHTCFVDGYKEGYEQAEKNAIERAVAWLDEHFIDGSFNSDRGYYGKMETYDFDTMTEMRESFIKAMEEE